MKTDEEMIEEYTKMGEFGKADELYYKMINKPEYTARLKKTQKMRVRTAVKLVLVSIVTAGICIGILVVCLNYLSFEKGLAVSIIIITIAIMGIFGFIFPWLFKDYSEYYWSKHQEKENAKNKV